MLGGNGSGGSNSNCTKPPKWGPPQKLAGNTSVHCTGAPIAAAGSAVSVGEATAGCSGEGPWPGCEPGGPGCEPGGPGCEPGGPSLGLTGCAWAAHATSTAEREAIRIIVIDNNGRTAARRSFGLSRATRSLTASRHLHSFKRLCPQSVTTPVLGGPVH